MVNKKSPKKTPKSVRGVIAERQVTRKLKGVDPEETKLIAEALIEQSEKEMESRREERVPGRVVGKFKTAFTLKDLEDIHGITSFTPEETVAFTIQGVERQFLAGVECLVPRCFKIAYDLRKQNMLKTNTLPETGYQNINQPGAGTFE